MKVCLRGAGPAAMVRPVHGGANMHASCVAVISGQLGLIASLVTEFAGGFTHTGAKRGGLAQSY